MRACVNVCMLYLQEQVLPAGVIGKRFLNFVFRLFAQAGVTEHMQISDNGERRRLV